MARAVAENVTNSLLWKHIATHSETVSAEIEAVLGQYEKASKLLSGIVDLKVLDWNESSLIEFIYVCRSFRVSLTPAPERFFMSRGTKSFDVVDTDELFQVIAMDSDSVKVYTSVDQILSETPEMEYNREEFDHPEPTYNGTLWQNQVINEMVFLTAIVETPLATTGISISLNTTASIAIPAANAVDCRMLFLDHENGVMIGEERGVVNPVEVISGIPVFPQLYEINAPLWEAVSKEVNDIKPESVVEIELLGNTRLVFKTRIEPNGIRAYTILTVFNVDGLLSVIFRKFTASLIVCSVVLCVTCAFVLWLTKRLKLNAAKRLAKEPMTLASPVNGSTARVGVIGQAIERLRKLQLRFPSDDILNRVIDSAVTNLSERRHRLWTVPVSAGMEESEFCRYLTPPSRVPPKTSSGYALWRFIRLSEVPEYPELGTLKFPGNRHYIEPVQQLMCLVVTILAREELQIQPFDPDSLIEFMTKCASKCCKDNIHTAHILFTLYYFLNGPFKGWVTDKLDLFILYFVAFVYDTDCLSSPDFERDDAFSDSTEELWHYDNDYESDSENNPVEHLKFYMSAFNNESAMSRNIHLTLEMFNQLLPRSETEDPVRKYFDDVTADVLFSLDNNKQFELIGEFCVRIQSPDFSVTENHEDRLIFMKALLKLCDYCQYFTSSDNGNVEAERFGQRILLQDASDPLIMAEFHYDHARLIVAPWIEQFVKFTPLSEIVSIFNKKLEEWKSIIVN